MTVLHAHIPTPEPPRNPDDPPPAPLPPKQPPPKPPGETPPVEDPPPDQTPNPPRYGAAGPTMRSGRTHSSYCAALT